jgi:signal transduction histidine kinase
MLGHELRNPLGALGNASMLVKRASDERMQKVGDVLTRQIKHLTRLVDDLLDVTRIRQGKIALRMQRVELGPLLLNAIEGAPLIAEKRHVLTVDLASDSLPVMGDGERLTQALLNVLGNSAKYTPNGGQISVTAERKGHEAVVRIKDNGVGIEPDLLPNVFDLFRQGDLVLNESHGGLGIGLTLVQRILVMHGGSIEAFSNGTGQGSEFVIRIPLLT